MMTDEELQKAIYAYNRQLKADKIRLTTLQNNEQKIRTIIQDFIKNPAHIADSIKAIRKVLNM